MLKVLIFYDNHCGYYPIKLNKYLIFPFLHCRASDVIFLKSAPIHNPYRQIHLGQKDRNIPSTKNRQT